MPTVPSGTLYLVEVDVPTLGTTTIRKKVISFLNFKVRQNSFSVHTYHTEYSLRVCVSISPALFGHALRLCCLVCFSERAAVFLQILQQLRRVPALDPLFSDLFGNRRPSMLYPPEFPRRVTQGANSLQADPLS